MKATRCVVESDGEEAATQKAVAFFADRAAAGTGHVPIELKTQVGAERAMVIADTANQAVPRTCSRKNSCHPLRSADSLERGAVCAPFSI